MEKGVVFCCTEYDFFSIMFLQIKEVFMMKMHEHVEGKGYFVGYKCKNCGRGEKEHKSDGKNCVKDNRKTIKDYHFDKIFEADEKKPLFVKFIL